MITTFKHIVARWCMLVIPAVEKLRLEIFHEFMNQIGLKNKY